MPTLADQLKWVLETAARVIEDRKLWAPKEVMINRLKICNVCEFKTIETDKTKCSRCGCRLHRKIAVHGSKCPEGFW